MGNAMRLFTLIMAAILFAIAAFAQPPQVDGWDVERDYLDDYIYTSDAFPDEKIILTYGVPGYWTSIGIELEIIHNLSSRAVADHAGCADNLSAGVKERAHYRSVGSDCMTLIGVGPKDQPIMLVALGSEEGAFAAAQDVFSHVVYGK